MFDDAGGASAAVVVRVGEAGSAGQAAHPLPGEGRPGAHLFANGENARHHRGVPQSQKVIVFPLILLIDEKEN